MLPLFNQNFSILTQDACMTPGYKERSNLRSLGSHDLLKLQWGNYFMSGVHGKTVPSFPKVFSLTAIRIF